ncbi:MAG: iron-containing alcohol dehydrogenase [Desulfobulbus sp.]|jgi:alcohol dehydrogenase YqhD (iron-dependent ADH family)|uniref:iron-containing alcohol dehydrogenase n=1 Tax=Desulfobulbus sp. TaxID=895 RepID=UPI0028447876|nr:iron-containing alcohol dehydrogenase [Desulfobulbus sp.]MDR2550237.1 iron-containing alcohol dehydrogenase [Desulfobulbus sp.]
MHNFVFHNPTKVLFGQGTVEAIGPETRAWGRRALLVYGRASLKRHGLHQRILDSLQAAGLEVAEHGDVRANPLLTHARQGIDKARAHQAEVIVAAGGGSVIDTAKAIAAGVPVAHDLWKFFTGKKSLKAALPVTTVLTLAGSGSEMNSGMVLTNEATGEKFGFGHRLLHPKASILDPQTTCTVPPDHTAFGAIDAISHLLEFYLTAADPDTPVQDRLMEGLIENSMAACNRCLCDPLDYHGRANLMWTSSLALSGLTAAGLGRVGFPMHLIEHSLSALYDVPHGAGMAVILLGWLRAQQTALAQRIAGLGRQLFDLNEPDPQLAAAQTIVRLANWLASVQAPLTLDDLGIPAADIPRIAGNTRGLARVWRLADSTPERVAAILCRCLARPDADNGNLPGEWRHSP